MARGPETDGHDLTSRYRAVLESATDHLDEATWERLACGELGADAHSAAADHVSRCAECAAVYRALSALRQQAHQFDSGAPSPELGAVRHVLRWSGVWRAALATAAIVMVVVFVRQSREAPVTRAGTVTIPIVTLAPGSASPAGGGPTFEWKPVANANHYRVELYAVDGLPLWKSADLVATAVRWPTTLKAVPGTYYWQVVAIRDGRELATSGLRRLDLTR
jgi:hypothetical protein